MTVWINIYKSWHTGSRRHGDFAYKTEDSARESAEKDSPEGYPDYQSTVEL